MSSGGFFVSVTTGSGQGMLIILSAAAALIALCIIILLYDNNRFVIRDYPVRSVKITAPLKLVFITDLHEKEYGPGNEKLLQAIREIGPDAVVIGGDTIISSKAGRHCAALIGRSAEGAGTAFTDEQLLGGDWCAHSLSLISSLSKEFPVVFSNPRQILLLTKKKSVWNRKAF